MSEYFPQAFMILSIIYINYRLFKMYPHVKEGYKILFFLNFWMWLPESLDEEGQEIRTELLTAIPIFVVLAIILAKSWN